MQYIITFTYGFFALLSQIILFKELNVLFAGQELFFGFALMSWLFFMGTGNILFAKLKRTSFYNSQDKIFLFVAVWCMAGFVSIASLIAIRYAKVLITFGELPSILEMFSLSSLLLAPSAVLLGFLFNYITTQYYDDDSKKWVYWPYALETIGACLAGVIYTFYIAGKYENLETLIFVTLFLIITGWVVYRPVIKERKNFPFIIYIFIGFYVLLSSKSIAISKYTKGLPWKGYELILNKETKFCDFLLLGRENSYSFVQNGMVTANLPDAENYENKTHWAMLAKGNAKNILCAGQGFAGFTQELKKYPLERIDFIEPDAFLAEINKTLLIKYDKDAIKNKIRVQVQDFRQYLKTTKDKYDVIIAGLPQGFNLEYNRYYTVEFFNEVKGALSEGGVFSFQLNAQENYINKEMALQINSIFSALRKAFKSISIVTGDELTIVASDKEMMDAKTLIDNYKKLGINNRYVMPDYINLKLGSEKTAEQLSILLGRQSRIMNSDNNPVTYRHTFKLYADKLGSPLVMVFFAVIAFIIVILRKHIKTLVLPFARLPVFWASLASVVIEMVLILYFQSVYGYVYVYFGLLFSDFMLGLFAGILIFSIIKVKPAKSIKFVRSILFIFASIFCLLLAAVLSYMHSFSANTILMMIYTCIFIAGLIAGWIYCIEGMLMQKNDSVSDSVAKLYTADLWGSVIGLIVFSAFLVQLFSYSTIILICAGVMLSGFALALKQTE